MKAFPSKRLFNTYQGWALMLGVFSLKGRRKHAKVGNLTEIEAPISRELWDGRLV